MRKMYVGALRRLDLAPPPRPKTPFDGAVEEMREEGVHSSAQGSAVREPTRPEAMMLPEPVSRSNLQASVEDIGFWSQVLSSADESDGDQAMKQSNLTLLQSELDRWSRLLVSARAENQHL